MKKVSLFIASIKKLPIWIKIIALVIVIAVGWAVYSRLHSSAQNKPQYQTAQAEAGTLVTSISASGSISTGSSTNITTKASGIVSKVYVKNGQTVKKGQKIADLTLDDSAQARQTIAYADYIDTINNQKTAEAGKLNTDIQMWKNRQAIFDALDDRDYKNNNAINPDTKKDYTDSEKMIIDKIVDYARKYFEASETAYKNADAQINKARAQVTAAWQDYLDTSSTITAPSGGVINNFTLASGVAINSVASSSSNSTSANSSTAVSSQIIGMVVNPNAQYQATVNLTEIDVIKVQPDQKVILTLDAYSDKSFTGKVLSINTSGQTSSGVTTYPTTILFDSTTVSIYPKMSVTAKIITDIKDNVILIPSSAVQTSNGQSTVRVLKDGQIEQVDVETAGANETQTAITSGLNEGETVVTSISSTTSQTQGQNNSSSPFSGLGGNRNFGGGGMIRMER